MANYTRYKKLDFGMFEGIEIGLVYAGAGNYIEWFIRKTSHYIEDLEEILSKIPPCKSPGPDIFHIGDLSIIPFFKIYYSLDDYLNQMKNVYNENAMKYFKHEFQIKNLIYLNNLKKPK